MKERKKVYAVWMMIGISVLLFWGSFKLQVQAEPILFLDTVSGSQIPEKPDETAPVFNLCVSSPERILDEVSYYKEDILVTFLIEEEGEAELQNCDVALYKDGVICEAPKIIWNKEKGRSEGHFSISTKDAHCGDGEYWFTVSYQDKCIYESGRMVLDTAAPIVRITYKNEMGDKSEVQYTYMDRMFYKEKVKLVLTIQEKNGRYQELKDHLKQCTMADIHGNPIEGTFEHSLLAYEEECRTTEEGVSWNFELFTEANYEIPIAYEDLAGNQAVFEQGETIRVEKVTVDYTEPELELTFKTEEEGFLDTVNYKEHGVVFTDKKVTVEALLTDRVSGIYLNDRLLKETKTEYVVEENEILEFSATDWSGNIFKDTVEFVLESDENHLESASAVITTLTKPSRTVEGKDYYNTDVQLNLCIEDTYSGLGEITYVYGNEEVKTLDYKVQAGRNLKEVPRQERTFRWNKTLFLEMKDKQADEIYVMAHYADNAGHKGKVEKTYRIDKEKPQIKVEYDFNEPVNGKYYNQARTATVTIYERNFSEKDVNFVITNKDGNVPKIENWIHGTEEGEQTKHTCRIVFNEDGDYTFTVSFMDLAGNKAEYKRVDEFTIDQTPPCMHVTYDNNESRNGYYYAQPRTATIEIEEHNFDADRIQIVVAMGKDAEMFPQSIDWRSNGDHHIATVAFTQDGEYTLNITGNDLAGNTLSDYKGNTFVVDQTAPELEFFNLEDGSANRGTVRPGIRYSDRNLFSESMKICLYGCKNGEQDVKGETTKTLQGTEILLDDFSYLPKTDDLYTLEAVLFDLAGNSSQIRMDFSVNRFGSVYSLDEKTNRLVGEKGIYYSNREQDLVITETNVDTLEFREITCSINGKLFTLKEGYDYLVEKNESEKSWKQYIYTIFGKNFTEEGVYLITVYSEDRANNRSDTSTKGKKLEFAIDKSSPSILISGVEHKEQYRESCREITVDVQDNVQLSKVQVVLEGKTTLYSAQEIEEADGKLVFTADAANHWQLLQVYAWDMAGNPVSTDEVQFLITPNIFVQFYMKKTLFYHTMAGIVVLTVIIIKVSQKRKKLLTERV